MGSRIILGLTLACSFLFGSSRTLAASDSWPLQVIVYWEGRSLDEPNLEALERLRAAYPDLLMSHMLNPSYFLDAETAEANLAAMHRILKADDEVGLYLSSVQSLVSRANVTMRYRPTFWGHIDEQDFCQKDCGLDVPLAGHTREELMRVFASADSTLRQVGFSGMKAFAARGWLANTVLQGIASSFTYRHDLSAMDPRLISPKLSVFPFYRWAKDAWEEASTKPSLMTQDGATSRVTIGGTLDFSEASEVLTRFDQSDPTSRPFQVALSQETAYFSSGRLKLLLKSLNDKAQQKNAHLVYKTASDIKNGRPSADPQHISKLYAKAAAGADRAVPLPLPAHSGRRIRERTFLPCMLMFIVTSRMKIFRQTFPR